MVYANVINLKDVHWFSLSRGKHVVECGRILHEAPLIAARAQAAIRLSENSSRRHLASGRGRTGPVDANTSHGIHRSSFAPPSAFIPRATGSHAAPQFPRSARGRKFCRPRRPSRPVSASCLVERRPRPVTAPLRADTPGSGGRRLFGRGGRLCGGDACRRRKVTPTHGKLPADLPRPEWFSQRPRRLVSAQLTAGCR